MSVTLHHRLEQLLAGDRAAAAWLYDTFAPGLYRKLRLRYRHLSGAEPDDLLHDAFVSFLRPDHRSLRGWLTDLRPEDCTYALVEKRLWDLACGLAANQRRSAWTRRVVPLAEGQQVVEVREPEGEAAARDVLEKLDRCIEGQTEEGYLYYQMRYVDGLRPRQIAAATGRAIEEIYRLKKVLKAALRHCSERLRLAGR